MDKKIPGEQSNIIDMLDDSHKIISFYEEVFAKQTAEIDSLRRRLKKALRLTLALINKVRSICAH